MKSDMQMVGLDTLLDVKHSQILAIHPDAMRAMI
jgi:hypothetical protein